MDKKITDTPRIDLQRRYSDRLRHDARSVSNPAVIEMTEMINWEK